MLQNSGFSPIMMMLETGMSEIALQEMQNADEVG